MDIEVRQENLNQMVDMEGDKLLVNHADSVEQLGLQVLFELDDMHAGKELESPGAPLAGMEREGPSYLVSDASVYHQASSSHHRMGSLVLEDGLSHQTLFDGQGHDEDTLEPADLMEVTDESEDVALMRSWFMMDFRNERVQELTRFCLLVSPAPTSLIASVYRRYGEHLGDVEFEKLELPRGSEFFMETYTCWQIFIPTSTAIRVRATFPRSGFISMLKTTIFGSSEVEKEQTFHIQRKRLQVNFLQGSSNVGDKENSIQHMAFNTVLVLLNHPGVMPDCWQEYLEHISRTQLSSKLSLPMLKKALKWLEWIQQKLKVGLTEDGWDMEWAYKMILAFLSQIHVLRPLNRESAPLDFLGRQMQNLRQNLQRQTMLQDLMKRQYEALLFLFSSIFSIMGSPADLPPFARHEFARAASELVAFTPAVKWSSCLDALCKADPSYSFISKWANNRKKQDRGEQISSERQQEDRMNVDFSRTDKTQTETDYEEALSQVLKFANDHPNKSLKDKAIRAAILAAPTALTLLNSIGILAANNLVSGAATVEEVEAFLSTEYGSTLTDLFEWLTELETPQGMAILLLQAFTNASSTSMVGVLRIFTSNFIRNQLTQPISRDSRRQSWSYLKDVVECPHILIVPLLHTESILVHVLVERGPLDLAAHVIVKLCEQVDALQEEDEHRGPIVDSLRVWLEQLCARASRKVQESHAQAPIALTPYTLYSLVTGLFGQGLKLGGYLTISLSVIIPSLLQQLCAVETIIKDAMIMSTFHSEVIASQYVSFARKVFLKHLIPENENASLDAKAEELLQWLCLQPNQHTSIADLPNAGVSMNGWIQQELLIALLDNLVKQNYHSSLSADKLVDSKFLLALLQVELAPHKVKGHLLYVLASRVWFELLKQVETEIVSVEVVSKILSYPNISWKKICQEQNVEGVGFEAASILVTEYMNTKLKGFHMLLDYGRHFEGQRCSGEVLQKWQSWMQERTQDCMHFTLNKIKEPNHWPIDLSVQYLGALLVLEDSKILENIFKEKECHTPIQHIGNTTILEAASSSGLKHTLWMSVANMLEASLEGYKEEWRILSVGDYPVDRLNFLLHGVNQEILESEATLAKAYFDFILEPVEFDIRTITLALGSWMNFLEKKSLKDPLLKLKSKMKLVEDEDLFLQNLLNLQTIGMCGTLGEFLEIYKKNTAVIDFFSSNEIEVLKQLAESEQLIGFLKENTDEDLRMLTDAIEEQAEDAVVDEITVSDLIHIDRVLRPLLQSSNFTLADLKAAIAKEVSECAGATEFSGKLNYCNANIHRIRHFVASLADRSSVLKSHMSKILETGVYTFALKGQSIETIGGVCKFLVLCGGNQDSSSRQQFTLTDLKDLRSRARMMLSMRRIKQDVPANQVQSTNSAGQRPSMTEALMEFVEQVNLAEKLLEQLYDAQLSGHLLFDNLDWSLHGLECLQTRVDWMNGQIACWHAALQRARQDYNCLNFFKGIELRLMYRCFLAGASSDKFRICWELLEWAKPGLRRRAVETCLQSCSFKKVEMDLDQTNWAAKELQLNNCLNCLGIAINFIFATVNSGVQVSRPNLPPSAQATNTLDQDRIHLVSVEDQQHELSVVVEIFHKHYGHLDEMATNLLLCSSRTTWEDIHLMMLRFLASDKESDVFVIAYVDKLTFECQSQLTERLQHLSATTLQQRTRHHLSLVCCTKTQALHGISHQLKVPIKFMDGLETKSLIQQLQRDWKQMTVVTSELSGMGKSRFIKNQKNGSCVSLPISGEVSHEYLILKLKNLVASRRSSLHLDITTERNFENLNVLLFELLICGTLRSSHAGVYRLGTMKVYVELANTLGNLLETGLFICSWLPQHHLKWDLAAWQISINLESDDQVVCIYLDKLAREDELNKQDIVFSGKGRNVVALPEPRCRELMQQYFIKDSTQMSYSVLTGFIRTFACQLRKFGENVYCTYENVRFMVRDDSNTGKFRSIIVNSLLEVARDLSLRSVKPWLHEEQTQISTQDINKSMHQRTRTMLRWSESNHVMIFFDSNGIIRILYRDQKLIPEGIAKILSIQARVLQMKLPDYSSLRSEELWQILCPIVCSNNENGFFPNYVLTPDNFLKMALVSLRINTLVPVIIMGETGCGKTSLLRALATFSSAQFNSLTLHAGSTEQDIESFIKKAEAQVLSENSQVWAFLDEINACPHLGFLNSILCHHNMSGKALHPKLVLLAACNPYRLQDTRGGSSGLQIKDVDKRKKQELAYTVHPLPEAMLDHVWDYGILSDSDERAYIAAMIGERNQDIVDLISHSQKFMRKHMGIASVSLRDVQRWVSLFDWFQNDIITRLNIKKETRGRKFVERRAKVLACALCYHCRFPGKDLRREYREMCCSFLSTSSTNTLSQAKFLKILHEEQRDILGRMEIPPGIAINSSLLENVFTVLVCLLNYIPVFVVGKPGSGKTLALHIIYSNLRGTDSKDEYFTKLPRILFLSYQGSQNSTSEGILKVFDKAKRYVHSNRERDMLVVVVLDEVGLAETSQHNPLKVLHPLLEPDVREIAVVGISNWSLDAAKMNRGVHLSQSDPGVDDLYQTSMAIFESYNFNSGLFLSDTLRRLAVAYHKYHAQQTRADFHGLRDFYSLVKSLRLYDLMLSPDQLAHSLWRNFGGGPLEDIKNLFFNVGGFTEAEDWWKHPPPVMDLVKENLQDPEARHLMLITKGDSASNILQHILQEDENFVVIRGSMYQNDKTEEYCYLMLSDIILYMEMGRHVLLENADQIWSSLYDMLNQHYTYVGGRRNCRIALGAYSNPMCFVHENFRCIVVVEEDQIPNMDPPFLNRFEKQSLTYESILSETQRLVVKTIRDWAHKLASKGCNTEFPESQMFAGFYQDSIPSLVMLHSSRLHGKSDDKEITAVHAQLIERCKVDLLQTAYVDAIARAHLSLGRFQADSEMGKFRKWTEMFLLWKYLHSLNDCIEANIADSTGWIDSIGVKLIITTCTPVQWSIQQDMEGVSLVSHKVTFMRLGDFTSERQLQSHIQKFWCDDHSNMLVLQADDALDKDHISLAKFHIDKSRKACQEVAITKHVVIIIHVQQGVARLSNFSFLCGWKQLTLHRLQKEPIAMSDYLGQSMRDILDHEAMPMKHIMARVLTWSYLCIKYEDSNITALYPQEMVQAICEDEALMTCIKQRALVWVLPKVQNSWQFTVLNNQKLLSTSASVHDAFVQYIEEQFREAVARIIYLLEKTSSLKAYFTYDAQRKHTWRQVFMLPDSLKCDMAPAPCYPEGYQLTRPLDLSLPFSSLYAAHLETTFQALYLENFSRNGSSGHQGFYESLIGNSIQKDVDASLTPMLSVIWNCIQWDLDSYIEDFAKINAARMIEKQHAFRNLSRVDAARLIENKFIDFQVLEWILRENLRSTVLHPSHLHILCWEKEPELKAEVSLALLCMSLDKIEEEVAALKAGRAPLQNFSEEFSIRCSKALLPTKSCVEAIGGIQAWLYTSQALTGLLPPVESSVLLFMLCSLQDLAAFVIVPLKKRGRDKMLFELTSWFEKNLKEATLVSIVRQVVDHMPNINKLDDFESKYWVDFLCAILKRHPDLSELPRSDLEQTFSKLMHSSSPSCMMGPVMLQLLSSYLSTLRVPYRKKAPLLMVLLSSTNDALFKKDWDTKAAGSILLSDQLYHYLRQTITPELLGGEHTERWDYLVFDECLCLATNFCKEEGPFTLQKMVALALWKSFLYSAAHLLNQVKTKVEGDKHPHKLAFSPAFVKALSGMSSTLKHATQTFFMKVLHWDVGLSTGDIQKLLDFCESQRQVTSLFSFLDHPLVRSAKNPLGFNPFTSTSKSFVAAEQALNQLLPASDGQTSKNLGQDELEDLISKKGQEEVRRFIKRASQEHQVMLVMAMASELFVVKAGARLSKAEWAALEWLKETIRKEPHWHPLLQRALTHLFTQERGGLWHSKRGLSQKGLELKCLTLDILFKVAALPADSPFRGYCILSESHFRGAYVLTDADNFLHKVEGLGPFREYVCSCGYSYIIGNCTRAAQEAKCPNCPRIIGGTNHKLRPGQHALKESGRIINASVVENLEFSLRICHRSFRLLRILVYCCFLIGAVCGGDLTELSAFMQLTNEKWSLVKALKKSIKKDMLLLSRLINCQLPVTSKFVHSMLQVLSKIPFERPLRTFEDRDNWEIAFQRMVENQPVQETIIEYLTTRGTDGLHNLLVERSPCPPASFQPYFRITKMPCLSDFETMFLQSKRRPIEHPCIAAVLDHQKDLKSLAFLLPIVNFCASLHQTLAYNITRHSAATTSIQMILQERSDLVDLYGQFEKSWNSVRLEVQGFECRQFAVPEMHKGQRVSLCLLEKKDQGIYITSIFELLRTRQNDFLHKVEAGLFAHSSVHPEQLDIAETSMQSVPVQLCKADQIVTFQDSWLNDLVCELGRCKLKYGEGTSIVYDDLQIERRVFEKLVQGKPILQADYVEFPYQQESFQRHATLISDVRELVPQKELPTEKLANISRGLTLEALGAGQMLANLELCLGFLRKTKAEPSEPLREYCKRWLDKESHPIFSNAVFDGVQVKHVVSLYEGLEEAASLAVEDLVTSSYRAELNVETRKDLKGCVVVKKQGWTAREGSSSNKLGAEAFRDELRRFMFRYLTADTFKPDDELSFYLTNPQLVTWPDWDVDTDTLDEIFPSSFKLKHSRALYIALKEMC